jgi:hypothetical protein
MSQASYREPLRIGARAKQQNLATLGDRARALLLFLLPVENDQSADVRFFPSRPETHVCRARLNVGRTSASAASIAEHVATIGSAATTACTVESATAATTSASAFPDPLVAAVATCSTRAQRSVCA